MTKKLKLMHPGEVLREEFLVPLKMSAGALAKACGLPRTRVERIASEQTGITADTALRLANALGTAAQLWLNLQNDYDVQIAKRHLGKILDRIETVTSRRRPNKLTKPATSHAQPLTRAPAVPIHCWVSRLDGRSGNHRKVAGEESPGSMDIRCRITTGGREPRESATESRPPRPRPGQGGSAVRVKGCGKSAPRRRQRGRHGKPHREQDRIGTARSLLLRKPEEVSGSMSGSGRPGRLLEAPGNWRPRGMAVTRAVRAARPTEPGLQAG